MPTPIETYNSSVLYTADGLTSVFPFPFAYQNAADIFVSKNDVDQAGSFTITGGTNVSLTPMPAAGARIKIYRKTGHSARRVDFTDGATITESDLDKSATQHFYMGQEGYDLAKSLVNTVGDVAAAVQTCTNAASSSYASQVAALSDRLAAQAAAFQADASNSAAISAKNAAESARDAALSYSNTSSTNAFDALTSKNTAVASASTATTQAGTATTARIASEAARDVALSAQAVTLAAMASVDPVADGTASIVIGAGLQDLTGGELFCYKIGKLCFLNFRLTINNAGAVGLPLCTLPSGYRPRYNQILAGGALMQGGQGIPYTMYVGTDGRVGLYNSLNLPNSPPTLANGNVIQFSGWMILP